MYDLCMDDNTLTQTMAEALSGMADIDEQTAAFLVPQLAELLGREADMNMECGGRRSLCQSAHRSADTPIAGKLRYRSIAEWRGRMETAAEEYRAGEFKRSARLLHGRDCSDAVAHRR